MQQRAAIFVTGNYSYETRSMTGILGKLKWESSQEKTIDKGLKGKASLQTDDLIHLTRIGRNHHQMAFHTPAAGTDNYKGSFIPQTLERPPRICNFLCCNRE